MTATNYELWQSQWKSQIFLTQQDIFVPYIWVGLYLLNFDIWIQNIQQYGQLSHQGVLLLFTQLSHSNLQNQLHQTTPFGIWQKKNMLFFQNLANLSVATEDNMQYSKVFINTIFSCIRPISLITQSFCVLRKVHFHIPSETNLVGPKIATQLISWKYFSVYFSSALTLFCVE